MVHSDGIREKNILKLELEFILKSRTIYGAF
mgnify:CR=1 FL=1